jgi:hypothetical protein
VVVHDLNVDRTGRAIRPFEADAPLIVDADAVLSFAIALQCFKPVSRKYRMGGGVTLSLAQDIHGESLSNVMLAIELPNSEVHSGSGS